MTARLFAVDPSGYVSKGQQTDADDIYRYRLTRVWDVTLPRLVWMMLNPSTATDAKDDRTVRRCVDFAKREHYGGIEVVNLYALRATKPEHLLDHPDPQGPLNADAVLTVIERNGGPRCAFVAAWGARYGEVSALMGRSRAEDLALGRVRLPLTLGVTKMGEPRHPLYVSGATPFEEYHW